MEEEKLDAAKKHHNDWGESSKEVLQQKWRNSRNGLELSLRISQTLRKPCWMLYFSCMTMKRHFYAISKRNADQ